MAIINITFNNFDLQTSTYLTNNIQYRQLAERLLDTKQDVRRGGFNIVDAYYVRKAIEITGWIKATTPATLRTAIDTLKRNLRGAEKDLAIDYGNGIINYKATVQSISIPEQHYHITQVPFIISFLVMPWGTSTTQLTSNYDISASPYTNSINVGGSFGPFPVITLTVNSKSSMTAIKVKNTDVDSNTSSLLVSRTFTASEVLVVDCDAQTIQVDAANVDFTGIFPEFSHNSNSFEITITDSGAFTVSASVEYYQTFL